MTPPNLFLRAEKEYKYANTEKGFLSTRIKDIFKPSAIKNRGYSPECTKEEIKKHFHEYVEKHGRNCFYCLQPWTHLKSRVKVGNKKNFKRNRFLKNTPHNTQKYFLLPSDNNVPIPPARRHHVYRYCRVHGINGKG